jgi:hypothetical protein
VLLVVCYSTASRQTLRNVCTAHGDAVLRRFGRAALFRETEFGAFLALRLRAKHGGDVQVEQTAPFNEFESVREPVREAARAYEEREHASTPYPAFAANADHPGPEEMRDAEL